MLRVAGAHKKSCRRRIAGDLTVRTVKATDRRPPGRHGSPEIQDAVVYARHSICGGQWETTPWLARQSAVGSESSVDWTLRRCLLHICADVSITLSMAWSAGR